MSSTFTTLPGVEAIRQQAITEGFDPGDPLTPETYLTPTVSIQPFERGFFLVAKYYRDPQGAICQDDQGGSGPWWDVDYHPDKDQLLARFTAA